MTEHTSAKTKSNRQRLLFVAKSFIASEVGGKAALLCAALVFFLLGVNGLNVVNSFVGRDFMTALAERNTDEFITQAAIYIAVFALSTAVSVVFRYSEQRLGLLWRDWLTRRLVTSFLADRTYYRLKKERGIENPDQRIADDIRSFTVTTLAFVLMVLNGSITIVAFSGVMWSISPLLFAVTLAYGAAGSFLTIKFGRPLIGLEYSQLDKEANFRSALLHVWDNAESIAVAQRESNLEARLMGRVDSLMSNYHRIILVHRNLGFFTTGYNYLIQIIPALVVAPLFLRGEVEFGVITQSAMAFAHLVGAFSLIVNQFQSLSSFAAIIARLGSLGEVIKDGHSSHASGIELSNNDDFLAYENLTLIPTDGAFPLLNDLTLKLPPNTRLLLSGTNEDAKQILFKATAGIWDKGTGHIIRPSKERMFFLPERPYLPPGTLREALTGSNRNPLITRVACEDILEKLGLGPVLVRLGGMDIERDWDSALSLDEQQLFSLARALLVRPRFVFLNRAGSALGGDQFSRILEQLAEDSIGYINLGKAIDPKEHHDAILELNSDGGWRFTTL